MILSEDKMIDTLLSAKNVLLIEPNYPSTYPPLGLSKISTFLTKNGIKSTYSRKFDYGSNYDLVCITSVFTYYSKFIFDLLDKRGFVFHETPIMIGGIMASIVPEVFDKYENVNVFKGYSKELDLCVPDYSIMHRGNDFDNFSFVFTSRGCPNRCPYCVVWRIEKDRWINTKWKEMIDMSRPNIMISDNNLSSIPLSHLIDIIDFAETNNKKLLFNNGFDCKYVTEEMAKHLSRVRYARTGMRLAFDRIEEDGIFQNAIKLLIDNGVPKSSIMIYVLFNFMDTPKDAYYRARECANLGVSPYPQYYRPLKILSKAEIFVGKHWTLNLGRAFRNYWLMHGTWSKQTFDEYIHSKDCVDKFKLTSKDIEMWDTNGGTELKMKKKLTLKR